MQAARGLEAAHAVGLIHRDVKPSNILLENGVERVKLCDFGLARAADDASLTQSGVVAGTPQYMSPEQAGGEPVDHRADLFSLGSVLYALCTGRPPFRAESTMAVLRRVSDDTARPVRELNPDIPDWLEAIVMKLHAKDPAERFQTSSEVALLFGRCLAYLRESRRGAPPPYPVERPKKPRRRRLAIAAVGLLALVALGAAGSDFVATVLRIKTADGTMVIKVSDPDVKVKVDGEEVVITGAGPQELRVKPGMHTVEAARGGTVRTQVVTVERGGKQAVQVDFEQDQEGTARKIDPETMKAYEKLDAERVSLRALLNRERNLSRKKGEPPVDELQARLNELETQIIDLLKARGTATTTDAAHDVPRATVTHNGRPIDARLSFTPADSAVAARPLLPGGGSPRRGASTGLRPIPSVKPSREGRVAIVRPGTVVPNPDGPPARVNAIAFAPDGRRLAVAAGVAPRADAGPAEESGLACVGEFDGNLFRIRSAAASGRPFRSVAFAPDGKTYAAGGAVESTKDADSNEPRYETARIFDAETGMPIRGLKHADDVNSVAYSPDGQFLATASEDGHIAVYEVTSGRTIGTGTVNAQLGGASYPAIGVLFAPDGRKLFAWTRDGGSGIWFVARGRGLNPDDAFQITDRPTTCAAFSPDGDALATGARDGSIALRDVRSGKVTAYLQKPGAAAVTALAFSPDGRYLASASSVGTATAPGRGLFAIKLWDVAARAHVADLGGPSHRIPSIAFAPDGKTLAAATADGTIQVWDVPSLPKAAAALDPLAAADDPPARHDIAWPSLPGPVDPIASPVRPSPDLPGADPFGPQAGTPRESLRTVSPRREPVPVAPAVPAEPLPRPVADPNDPFTPLPTRAGSAGLAIGRRALPDGARPEGEAAGTAVLTLAVAPDGKTFATGSEDGMVRILDAASRRVVREMKGHAAPVRAVAYSPDGIYLASAASDQAKGQGGEVVLWNAATGRLVHTIKDPLPFPLALAVSPDGKTLAIGCWDGTIRLRKLVNDEATTTLHARHRAPVRALAFAPDGETIASAGDAGLVEIRKPDGSHVETLPGQGGVLTSLSYAPNGQRLAAGGGRSVIVHDWRGPGKATRTPFALRRCEVLALAFSPDGSSLAAAGGNVAPPEPDHSAEVARERKIKQLDEARMEKELEVTMKRNAIAEMQAKNGGFNVAGAKDRNAVTIEEYRQLVNELLRVQIEIVKAEAQVAVLQGDRPTAALPGDRPLPSSLEKRMAEARQDLDALRKESRLEIERPTLERPVIERPEIERPPGVREQLRDVADAKKGPDGLSKDRKPEAEATARRDTGRADDKPRAAVAPEELQFTDKDYARIFYAHTRVTAVKERYDRAKEKYKSVKEKVRDVSDPSLQNVMKDMVAAQKDLDGALDQSEAGDRGDGPPGRKPDRRPCPTTG